MEGSFSGPKSFTYDFHPSHISHTFLLIFKYNYFNSWETTSSVRISAVPPRLLLVTWQCLQRDRGYKVSSWNCACFHRHAVQLTSTFHSLPHTHISLTRTSETEPQQQTTEVEQSLVLKRKSLQRKLSLDLLPSSVGEMNSPPLLWLALQIEFHPHRRRTFSHTLLASLALVGGSGPPPFFCCWRRRQTIRQFRWLLL